MTGCLATIVVDEGLPHFDMESDDDPFREATHVQMVRMLRTFQVFMVVEDGAVMRENSDEWAVSCWGELRQTALTTLLMSSRRRGVNFRFCNRVDFNGTFRSSAEVNTAFSSRANGQKKISEALRNALAEISISKPTIVAVAIGDTRTDMLNELACVLNECRFRLCYFVLLSNIEADQKVLDSFVGDMGISRVTASVNFMKARSSHDLNRAEWLVSALLSPVHDVFVEAETRPRNPEHLRSLSKPLVVESEKEEKEELELSCCHMS